MAAKDAVFYDKAFELDYAGEKVSLRVLVDFSRIMTDISHYSDKLMMVRGIPFDTATIPPADPMLLIAANQMPWIKDNNEIVRIVRAHYEMRTSQVQNGAAVLAVTRTNAPYQFDPKPYDEQTKDDWDSSELPEPPINLLHPIERRLKQIYDLISSDVRVYAEFQNAMQTIFIEASRRAEVRDEDGFRAGRPDGDVPTQAVSGGSLSEI